MLSKLHVVPSRPSLRLAWQDSIGVIPHLDHVVTLARLVHVHDVHLMAGPSKRPKQKCLGFVPVKGRRIQLVLSVGRNSGLN